MWGARVRQVRQSATVQVRAFFGATRGATQVRHQGESGYGSRDRTFRESSGHGKQRRRTHPTAARTRPSAPSSPIPAPSPIPSPSAPLSASSGASPYLALSRRRHSSGSRKVHSRRPLFAIPKSPLPPPRSPRQLPVVGNRPGPGRFADVENRSRVMGVHKLG